MSTKIATAEPFAAPLVERLSVRVVVDSFYERFIPDATHPAVTIEHVRQIRGREMSTLAGEWGLSLHLESRQSGDSSHYLLDFGHTPEIVGRNFDLLGIEPARLNGLILSHGHRDHYGGLLGFLAAYRERMRGDLCLFAGGEGAFREKWLNEKSGGPPPCWGVLDRAALETARVKPVCCGTAQALLGAFTTGRIARQSFERVLPSTLVEQQPDHFTATERRGRLVPDQHPDEHATCYIVQGRGLVVISSCGHSGLINTIKTAMAVASVDKLHAVLGGFHLGPAPQDYVDHTVAELKLLDPDVVVPMHCSGTKFIAAMRAAMPDRLVTSNIGSRFTFAA